MIIDYYRSHSNLEEKGRLHVVSKHDAGLDKAEAAFLEHPDQQNCLILSPVNEDRISINDIFHNAIKPDGVRELDVEIHSPVFMNGTSRCFAKNYHTGQNAFIEKIRGKIQRSYDPSTVSDNIHNGNRYNYNGQIKRHRPEVTTHNQLIF